MPNKYIENFCFDKSSNHKALNNIFISSISGFSDYSFRKLLLQYSPGLMFCEMIKVDSLIRNDVDIFPLMAFSKEMHPIGAQIYANSTKYVSKAAKMIEALGFDCIDLNCACPVNKIVKSGCGAFLLKNPKLIVDILHEMVSSVTIPVTLKVRAGWDEDNICIEEICKLADLVGAKIIFVHGRTRKQGYTGKCNLEYIAKAKKAAKNIKVFGNGDLFSAENVKAMFDETKCDGVILARGVLRRPWLIQEIKDFYLNKKLTAESSLENKILVILEKHFHYMLNSQEERKVVLNMKKMCCYYLRNVQCSKKMKCLFMQANSVSQIKDILIQRVLYE